MCCIHVVSSKVCIAFGFFNFLIRVKFVFLIIHYKIPLDTFCCKETLSGQVHDSARGPVVMSNLVPLGRFLLNWPGGDDYRNGISRVNVSQTS